MIDLERDGDVFVLRMQGGENRIDVGLLAELDGALDAVEASEGAAALVTTGSGKFYSTGLDLEALADGGAARGRDVLAGMHALFARLLAFPTATVAALNGHAFAGGAMLALAHDFRVMGRDRGYFCLPEVDLATGQPLTPGMYALIDARLERATFHEALITGRRYPAPEAVTRGIVHEALSEDAVLPRAVEMARALAGKDRATLGALKRGLFGSALKALAHTLSIAVFVICAVTGAAQAQPSGEPQPAAKRLVLRGLAFGSDTAYIEPISRGVLEFVVDQLQRNPGGRVRIEGHTCSLGSEEYNRTLSLRRAEAVGRILVGYGIAPDRIQAVGIGETRPVAPNDTRDGRAMNRRVELVLLE